MEPFRIKGNLQQKDLFDAFIPDDALKHRNVRHTCYMQDPCFLAIIVSHGTAHAESKSTSLFDPFGDVSCFFNRTDQQRSLLVCLREELLGQLARQKKMANQKDNIEGKQETEQQRQLQGPRPRWIHGSQHHNKHRHTNIHGLLEGQSVTAHKTSRKHRMRSPSRANCGDRQAGDCSEIVQDESLKFLGANVLEDYRDDRQVTPKDERKNNRENTVVGIPQPSDAMPKH
jgi:hypothetical protein